MNEREKNCNGSECLAWPCKCMVLNDTSGEDEHQEVVDLTTYGNDFIELVKV